MGRPDSVWYHWTALDQIVAQRRDGKSYVTPYYLFPDAVPGSKDILEDTRVQVSIKSSSQMWSVDRFFKPPGVVAKDRVWEDVPSSVSGYSNIKELCDKLLAADPIKYADYDLSKKTDKAKNDWALLLFDYWENTDWRYKVTKGSFSWETLQASAMTLPTEAGGEKLKQVIALPSKSGVPIQAPPAGGGVPQQKPPAATVVVPDPFFDPTIAFKDATDVVLTPLNDTGFRDSKLRFDVRLNKLKDRDKADQVTFRIRKGDGTILYEEIHKDDDFVSAGDAVWTWDGYSNAGVFDTSVLTSAGLTVEVEVSTAPGTNSKAFDYLKGIPVPNWLMAKVVAPTKMVYLDVYLVPLQRSGDSLSVDQFRTVMGIVTDGIAKHWTKKVDISGDTWNVQASATFRAQGGIEYTIIGTDDPAKRSCNLRILSSTLSVWFYYCDKVAEHEHREVAAHEFGHTVLGSTAAGKIAPGPYSTMYSLTHKGTSTMWQSTASDAPSYPPAPEECDVMFYYKDYEPADAPDRCFGASDDVRHMITLAQVDFRSPSQGNVQNPGGGLDDQTGAP